MLGKTFNCYAKTRRYVIDSAGMVPRKTAYLGPMPSTDGMGKRG
jgi:hypothetical protein